MSSIDNVSKGQYTQKQQEDLQNLDSANQKYLSAVATGDKKAIAQAGKEATGYANQAVKDGISKDVVRDKGAETHQQAVASFLGGQKTAGKPIDDTAAAATLHNDYDAFAKKNGLDAKKSETFDKWKAQITPYLKKSGLSDDEIGKAIDAAAKYKFTNILQRIREVKV